MRILYVEDERMTRTLLAKLLERQSAVVHEAENGLSGLKKFCETKPDLVITNLEMPEMSGFEMICKIREIDANVPIIVTTAYRDEAMKTWDQVDAFVFKPIKKSELISAMERLIPSYSPEK